MERPPLRQGIATVASCLLVWGGLAGCVPQEQRLAGRPRVVATSTFLADWTQQVGQGVVEVEGLLRPGDDPHLYEPRPTDTRALERADLILYNGYNLEPNLIRLVDSVGERARRVAVAEVIPPLQLAKGDQTVPDPHVWGDVAQVVTMVALIRDELVQLRPADAPTLTRQAETYQQTLAQLDTWVERQTATIPAGRRYLVSTHDAFQYYAQAYGLQVPGTLIGISTEEQPSAQTLRGLVTTLKQLGIPTIFAETTINPQLMRTVAQEAGVTLAAAKLYSDSTGPAGTPQATYVGMMVHNTCTIVVGLGGRCQPFTPALGAAQP